ncbi:MAG: hypothetical protein CW691_00940 [Candidatus Bathyarchaeum sp.]|nr:MAG: hypothetical protein CW691_00940 [Candidatus Bathyarchaeum sp.]
MISRSKLLIICVLIISSVTVSLIVLPILDSLSTNNETFSELWLLGPEHKAENYPSNVTANEDYTIFVGVSNQLDHSAYYAIYVKLCNQTELLPNSTAAQPSPLNSIHEFQFNLLDQEMWETSFTFAVDSVLLQQNVTHVESITINGDIFPVNFPSTWDSNRNGFYYTLLFELWCYDETSSSFQYTNQNVRLQLNITSPF